MLTKDILFGMNVLTRVGFLVMGLSLTLHRTGNAGVPLSIGLMCAGTALVFYGLFVGNSSKIAETDPPPLLNIPHHAARENGSM